MEPVLRVGVSADDRNVRHGRAVFIAIGLALSLLVPVLAAAVTSAGGTGQIDAIAAGVQQFLLFAAGVFALIAAWMPRPARAW